MSRRVKVQRKRVGSSTVKIERGSRDESVGIGDRFTTHVEGKVTALAASPGNLFVGSSKGVLMRLETQTGRRCARATFGAPITKLAVRGIVVTVSSGGEQRAVKAATLRPVPARPARR